MRATLRVVAVLLAVPAVLPARAAVPPAATLAFASGGVMVETKSGGGPAKIGQALASGDAVSTAAGATAVIAIADGSRLKLRGGSRVVLSLPGPRAPMTEILLSLGSVFAKVSKRLPGAEFRVRTPTAVAAVRGTEFFTAYGRERAGASDLWVCVNAGVVEVGTTASRKVLPVPQGKGVLIKSGLDLTRPQAFDWTKKLNWNMDPASGGVEDKTSLDAAYADLLDQDYR